MAQQLLATSDLIKWCDDQVAQGKEISIAWEGGGDSGWVYFKINDEQVSDSAETPEMQELVELMYDQLDYGSWAGEFSASGEAVYNPTEKAFVGTDYYSEDETEYWHCNLELKVPKDLWFDRLEYNIENEDSTVSVAFIIRNGFLTDRHSEITEQLEKELEKDIDEEIQKFTRHSSEEFRSIWQNEQISRSEFTEKGDHLVYTIDNLNMGVYRTQEKDIYLQLITEDDE